MPFSTQWFLIYYVILGLLFISGGCYLAFRTAVIKKWLLRVAKNEKPPVLLIRILKYLALFTLPGLILAFIPFSWIELLFCIWSLLIMYIAGVQLVRWEQSRVIIKSRKKSLRTFIRRGGAIMVAVGFAILLLAYSVVERAI
jgi:hypothetical protein